MNDENERILKKLLDHDIGYYDVSSITLTGRKLESFVKRIQEQARASGRKEGMVCLAGLPLACLEPSELQFCMKHYKERIAEAEQRGIEQGRNYVAEGTIKFCEKIIRLDKTPPYAYAGHGGLEVLNAQGDAPPKGQCWKTPRELAQEHIAELKQAIASARKGGKP